MNQVPEATADRGAPNGDFKQKFLFWACFISLVATSFGFIIRALIISSWGEDFGLSSTQQGEIFGAGLWPFAISIVLFSLIIDKVGYGKAMGFAFACHVLSAIITISATGYWGLYVGTFILALGNGTVEAVINPVVATMFPKQKTKWLTILHAGWPGGLVLGGLLVLWMEGFDWRWKVGLVLIPVIIYGLMMLRCYFPPNERVAAGVPYKDMLKEVGTLGALIVVALIVREVGRVFGWHDIAQVVIGLALVGAYGFYINWAPGRPLFIFLLLIMIPLATTELGTDSWITDLMGPAMSEIGLSAGWVLVYTSAIMMVLRFFAGPIVHALSPLGVLIASSIIAAVGLVFLSTAGGIMILIAATIYGVGKSFFWPAMLGMVAEQSPRGGALTLNTIAGVGMLGVGIIGTALLGNIQDKEIDKVLDEQHPALHTQVVGEEAFSVFGTYRPLNRSVTDYTKARVQLYQARARAMDETGLSGGALEAELSNSSNYQGLVKTAYERQAAYRNVEPVATTYEDRITTLREVGAFVEGETYEELQAQDGIVDEVTVTSQRNALRTVAIFPVIMLICYIILFFYFQNKGGYRAVHLETENPRT